MNPDSFWQSENITDGERAFCEQICQLKGEGNIQIKLLMVMLLRGLQAGSICVSAKEDQTVFLGEDLEISWENLSSSSLFPDYLVDFEGKFYFARYHHYQNLIANWFRKRSEMRAEWDPKACLPLLDALFPPAEPILHTIEGPDLQRIACAMALSRSMLILTGGPGTGKTTTVAKLLHASIEVGRASSDRILLLAPTGKASARLDESIRQSMAKNPVLKHLSKANFVAQTIHRALKLGRSTLPKYNRNNPIPADLMIVDEASMIDLPLFAKLVDAIPDSCRVIFMGDPNQLASVEVGAVLADLCQIPPALSFEGKKFIQAMEPEMTKSDWLEDGKLKDSCIHLTRSYRFHDASPLGNLAQSVLRGGDPWRQLKPFQSFDEDGVFYAHHDHIKEILEKIYEDLLAPAKFMEIQGQWNMLEAFRILCALRKGPFGMQNLNRWFMDKIQPHRRDDLFPGLPVMVQENNYDLNIYNGDQGIVSNKPNRDVMFPSNEGWRAIRPSRLGRFEPAYAMTIHKSQGSEFDRVLVVLPKDESRILSRELVYTALTRAKKQAIFIAEEAVFNRAVQTRIRRASGLDSLL